MKYAWICIVAVAGVLLADETKPDPKARLAGLDWMAGSWKGEMWGGEFFAYYSTPEGGKILSHSYLVKGGKKVFYEFEMFDVQKGEVAYSPFPAGRPAGGFLLKQTDQKRAVFENPKKDYPTRIVFERQENLLQVTLSDPFNKSPKKEVFRLNRQP